ncbi:Gar1/Naf1 family protein [uncultured Methanobrevibacter sp.]|uniref:Gar1/Naf1 family protein n=1 Tax=uncultured Methanobrevibacter sp. TaxID=253161 RepID=UPI0025FC0AB2|nr:Gar1/Naf1 family protein [uncultured Methanobrevibacter sp.]
MKFLGNISHLANSGKLIVKTTKTPPAGAFVFTNDKQKIGKVYSIFGPVKNPYVSVNIFRSVNRRDLESRHGEKLFVSTKSEMEKMNRKNKNSKSKKGSKANSKYSRNSKNSRSRKSNSRKRRNQ